MPHTSLPRKLAVAYILLIAYACLHPLSGWRDTGLPLFDFLVAPWPKYFEIDDLVHNVLGYLPLGFILAAALPEQWRRARLIVVSTALGALLSLSLETTQHYLPTRVSSNIDLGANTAGAFLGALMGAWWGRTLFAPHGGLSRWRARHIIGGHTGDVGLLLLFLWILTQLTPDSLLFGSGDLRRLLDIPPPLPFSAERFIAFETILTASTLLAVGLFARCIVHGPDPLPIVALLLLGVGAKTLAASLFFVPPDVLAWLTPGAARGLAVGSVLLGVALLLPRVVQHALAGAALLAATALVNLLPENPYPGKGSGVLNAGNFLNFHGLTFLVASLWPFIALAYL